MDRSVFAVGRTAKPITEAALFDLRKNEFSDCKLPLGLCIDSLEKNGIVGQGIPTLAILLDFFICRDPIQCWGQRWKGDCCQEEEGERAQEDFPIVKPLDKYEHGFNLHYSGHD